MYISTLQIRNFRNYESEIFKFDRNTNTIIGENDSGKTNAFTALRILLDDSYYYSNKTLKESDFFQGINKDWQGEWIIISATFEGISQAESEHEVCSSISLDSENGKFLEGLISNADGGVGNLSLFIRPNRGIRNQLFNLSEEGNHQEFDKFRKSIRLSDYEFFYTSRADTNFCNNEKYTELVGNLSEYKASNPQEDDEAVLGARVDMADIYNHISVVYIDALRDVLREMKNSRNPIKRVIETIESKISNDDVEALKKIIKELNNKITTIPEINNIGDNLNLQLNSIIGSVYSPNLLLSSTMSDDMASLTKFLSIIPEEGIDLSLLGLGHLNMIYLALKIVEFEACRSRELLNIMLIEEPEAHIHHHIQKTLFRGLNLHENYTQIFMSTHSAHLAEVSEISRMNILKSFNGKTAVMQPANELDLFAKNKLEKNNLNLVKAVERYLDVKRNGLLFSKGVILVEGDAEEILIPQMVKKVFGITLDELGIGLINIGSTSFEYIASLFDDKRIQRKCAIITDLDKQAVETDNVFYRKNAEEIGLKRKEKLSSIFDDNDWVASFYASTTFETEFLDVNKEVISNYLDPIIDNEFKDKNAITRYKEEIQSEDFLTRNLAMLKLADRIGKGWFAIELGEQLDPFVKIPKYIMDAIAFACQEIVDISIYRKIIAHANSVYEKNLEIIIEDINAVDDDTLNSTIHSLFYLLGKDSDSVYLINKIETHVHLLNQGVSK